MECELVAASEQIGSYQCAETTEKYAGQAASNEKKLFEFDNLGSLWIILHKCILELK